MEGATGSPPPRRRAIRKRRTTTTGDTNSYLPDEIICDILSRLPLKSILKCKQVSNSWRLLLLEPYFAKLHLSRSPLSLIFHNSGHGANSSRFGVLELDDPARLRRRKSTLEFRTEICSRIEIVGSCNGTICMLKLWGTVTVIVCNPIRGQFFTLPKPPETAAQSYTAGYGFGYSPSTDQYKVLRFTETCLPSSRFDYEVYTLGNDDAWRSIGATGQTSPRNLRNFVFLNGALHWIGSGDSMCICCFDIKTEQFGSLPLPSEIGDPYMRIGVVDNFLYICDDRSSPSSVNIWVMKDYGKIGSFVLEWVIDRPFPYGLKGEVKLVKILKDGTVWVMLDKKILASYNPKARVLQRITYYGMQYWEESVADVPSFLSLPGML